MSVPSGRSLDKLLVLLHNEPYPDKAKPSVKGGRKAAGLVDKMAELPKVETLVVRLFYWSSHSMRQEGEGL